MNIPIQLGKYLLLDRINIGGMAEVFRAKTYGAEGFERTLAIKRILPNMAEDEEFINMFVDEARIAVQLTHANICQVYELGRFENQYYIAMEYVPGTDLRQLLDRFRDHSTTLPTPVAALIASRICEGLDYAHTKTDASGKPLGVIHRDVSPQNILVGFDGSVKITDFGIAKAEDRASKTQAGVLKGKFAYMSPEQVRGQQIDARSDLFAVGILLYEMLTGKRLFLSDSDFSTLQKVREAEVEAPTIHNSDLAPELEAIILKALAREPAERYASASDLGEDLQRFLIADNTIFNEKKLAAFISENYADEIAREQKKVEELQSVRIPPGLLEQDQRSAPSSAAKPSAAAAPNPDEAEKTVIFEAAMLDQFTAGSSR